jgi:hypothetical protein
VRQVGAMAEDIRGYMIINQKPWGFVLRVNWIILLV